MKQARVYISGFVQGIGFRHFVRGKANELGLTGWVKNLPDGRVEILFQGSRDKIEEAIKECNKGPFLSEVKDIVVEWEDSKVVYKDFEIM